MDLLPHNKKAYNAVKRHLKSAPRTCVIHPTGTGKSMIALQLIEDKPKARILYITSVATNLLEFWNKVEKLGSYRMVLGLSRSSIPKVADDEMKGDLDGVIDEDAESEVISYEDRQEMLKKAMEFDESYMEGPVVQFCLYAGLDNMLNNFDLIILDEFHRAGASQWEGKVRHLLSENENAKIVGFSATPVRMDGKDMRELFNNDVAAEMELSSAVINGLLPLPKYWMGKVSFEQILDDDGLPIDTMADSHGSGKQRQEKLRKRGYPTVAKRHLEAGTGLRDVFREALIPENATHGKFIVFCRTIRNTRSMVKASNEWFDWVDEVHRYEMHTQDRDGFGKFASDDSDSLRLLFVVDMLTEGVHLDDLDGVIMIRPTESMRIYFQQMGRALAVTTHREHPLILDIVSNAGIMKGGMDFMKGIGREMGMEEEEMDKFFHITAEAADFVSYLQETEYDYYGAMKDFYETHGHLYIPHGYKVDGHDVGREFYMIRSRKNQLSAEYRKKYEDIGMDWDITTQWMQGFWIAQEYFEEFGNLDVPSTLGDYHGFWLYDWLKKNRLKQDVMFERQRMMLDSIGMDWTITSTWEERFSELVEYKNTHGHCDVPGDEGALGRWVFDQRRRPPEGERKEKLDALGFEWDGRVSRSRNAWREGVKHSKEFYEKHGNLKVPKGYVCSDGYKLGNFIRKTKSDKRMEELEKEVIPDPSTDETSKAGKSKNQNSKDEKDQNSKTEKKTGKSETGKKTDSKSGGKASSEAGKRSGKRSGKRT